MRFTTAIVAVATTLIASASAACDPANLQGPDGNPTSAPLAGETVKMGAPYTITWQPTTPGPIDIVLLAGPTAQNLSQIATVATGITNNGSYTWDVPTSSAGLTSTLTSGYGFQLIDQSSCTYQFSPNFGIEDPTATTATYTLLPATTTATANATGVMTGTGMVTSPIVSPTGSMTVPATLRTTASSAGGASATGSSDSSGAMTLPRCNNAALILAAGALATLML